MKDWALILGASSGIGAKCAISLAKKGINIYGVYLRKKSSHVETIMNEIKKYNVSVIYKKANVSNEKNRNNIIKEICNMKNVRVKMLIHSIAFGTLKPIIQNDLSCLTKKNIDMTLDVMCNNLLYWSQDLFHSGLLKKGSHILTMTSAGGRKNWKHYGAISLAKAGIESITRQLSIELAPSGIAVNSIQAGVTDTDALRKIPGFENMMEKSIANNPHGRLTTTDDVADFVELLVDYESSWMTGNIIRLDGGEDITG